MQVATLETIGELSGTSEISRPLLSSVRCRRTKHSSSESSEAGEFLISSVKYRVAAPPARPLPIQSVWTQDCDLVREVLGHALEEGVTDILSAHGIEPLGPPRLWFRCVPEEKSEGQPTIVVEAEWTEKSSRTWELVVREAKQFVDKIALTSDKLSHLDIGVEIIAEQLTEEKFASPVPSEELTSSLVRDWSSIRDEVGRILDSHAATEGKVTSVSLIKLGPCNDPALNPLTVYVSLEYGSEEASWPAVATEIQRHIDTYPYHLHLHLEHNSPESLPAFEFPSEPMSQEQIDHLSELNFDTRRPYKTLVGLGDDLAAAKYIERDDGKMGMPMVGTLGCWVEIKTKRAPDWTRYALTNYHVLRPAIAGFHLLSRPNGQSTAGTPSKDSDLWKADVFGISPATRLSSPISEIEHPSRLKHRFTATICREEIAENAPGPERTEREEHLANIIAFFANGNQRFGTIYAASGFARRSRCNGRMDWALIKPLDVRRIGSNNLPTTDEWVANKWNRSLPLFGARGANLRQPPANGLGSMMNNNALIYKKGAATGATIGVFSTVESDVVLKDDAHLSDVIGKEKRKSQEFMYIGKSPRQWLAQPGDSGSIAFDKEGRAVGLLFRGHRAQQAANSWAYISPIEDVFHDIQDFSKGQITDIRIAKF